MLVLDGATLLTKDTIEPRFVVYPHHNYNGTPQAFSLTPVANDVDSLLQLFPNLSLSTHARKRLATRISSVLAGKGSKHHGAANASVLLWEAAQEQRKQNKELGKSAQGQKLGFRIITISADGPIKEWPDELGLVQREET